MYHFQWLIPVFHHFKSPRCVSLNVFPKKSAPRIDTCKGGIPISTRLGWTMISYTTSREVVPKFPGNWWFDVPCGKCSKKMDGLKNILDLYRIFFFPMVNQRWDLFWHVNLMWWYSITPPKINVPGKGTIFHPSIFRGYVSFQGGYCWLPVFIANQYSTVMYCWWKKSG